MGVGAKDYIDKLIVEKYNQAQVDNHEQLDPPEKGDALMRNMSQYYCYQRSLVGTRDSKVDYKATCKALSAKVASTQSLYRNTQKEREQLTAS